MCTRILKKESSSRALAFVVLLFMMPLGFIGNAQSCRATERSPLLVNEDVEEGRGTLQSVIVQSDDPLREIRVAPNLLEKTNFPDLPLVKLLNGLLEEDDTKTPAAELDKVVEYLTYVSKIDLRPRLIEAIRDKGVVLSDDPTQCEKVLFDRALAASSQGPVALFLKKLATKINRLQKVVPKFQEQNNLLRERVLQLVATVNGLQTAVSMLNERVELFNSMLAQKKREVNQIEEENQRIKQAQQKEIEQLRTTRFYLWIALPTVTVIVGTASVFLTHYYWR